MIMENYPEKIEVEKKKSDYLEELEKGRPEEVAKRQKGLYEGKRLEREAEESEESKSRRTEAGAKIDIEAFQKAYQEYLKNPKELPKPKPEDFIKEKGK